jgi:hypothetical protein
LRPCSQIPARAAALAAGATPRARTATAPSFVLIPIVAVLAAAGCVLLVVFPDHPAGRALAAPAPPDRTTIISHPSRNVLSITDNGEIVVAPARLAGRPPPG